MLITRIASLASVLVFLAAGCTGGGSSSGETGSSSSSSSSSSGGSSGTGASSGGSSGAGRSSSASVMGRSSSGPASGTSSSGGTSAAATSTGSNPSSQEGGSSSLDSASSAGAVTSGGTATSAAASGPDSSSSAAPSSSSLASVQQGVSASAGGVVTFQGGLAQGAAVDIPAGALVQDTVITVGDALAVEPPEGMGFIVAGPAVQFGPGGTQFMAPVTVTLPFDPAVVGTDTDLLRVAHRDDQTHAVTLLTPAAPLGSLLTVAASSFSTFQPVLLTPVQITVLTADPAEVVHAGTTTIHYTVTNGTSCLLGAVDCVDHPDWCIPSPTPVPLPSGTMPIAPNGFGWAGGQLVFPVKMFCDGVRGPTTRLVEVRSRPVADFRVQTPQMATYGGYEVLADGQTYTVLLGDSLHFDSSCFTETNRSFEGTFLWSFDGATADAATQMVDATFMAAGTFHVALTCTNAAGTTSPPVNVTLVVRQTGVRHLGETCDAADPAWPCDRAAHLLCTSSVCVDQCTDGLQNAGEVGVDCGGPCAACTNLIGGMFQELAYGYVNVTDAYVDGSCQPIPHRIWGKTDAATGVDFATAQATCANLPPDPMGRPWHLPRGIEFAGPRWSSSMTTVPWSAGIIDTTGNYANHTALPNIAAAQYWMDDTYFGPTSPCAADFSTGMGVIGGLSDLRRVRCVAYHEVALWCGP